MFEGDSSSYMLFDGLMEEGMELATEVIIRAEELTRTLYVNKERLLKNANINEGLDNSEYVMMNVAAKFRKKTQPISFFMIRQMKNRAGRKELPSGAVR